MTKVSSGAFATTAVASAIIVIAELSLLARVAQGATATTTKTTAATAGGNAFDNIRSLADDAEAQSTALYRDLDVKQGEITSLATRLNACLEGSQLPRHATPAPFRAEEELTPTSSPEQPAPVGPSPRLTPAPMPIHEEEDGQGGGDTPGGGGPRDRSPLQWIPRIGDTWNYNLDTPVDTSADVDVFFIDMDGAEDTITELHSKGKWVSCYMSVGTTESWRGDVGAFPEEAVGKTLKDWKGEKWLDVRYQGVRDVMTTRVIQAKDIGCDAIEPDNMAVYAEKKSGVDVSESDQIEYNKWFASTVHEHGMAVGMKNALGLLDALKNHYDFAINEECHEWKECSVYTEAFLDAGRPVFNVEYRNTMDVCEAANKQGLDTIIKDYDLKASFCSCADSSRSIDCDHVLN